MDLAATMSLLKRHEGFRQFPYRDAVGVLTVGYGRNLQAEGISEAEASMLLQDDVRTTFAAIVAELPWIATQADARKGVLTDMAVNMGVQGLLGFKLMLAAMQRGDYAEAANQMLDSIWAKQVGERAVELAGMMRTGLWASV